MHIISLRCNEVYSVANMHCRMSDKLNVNFYLISGKRQLCMDNVNKQISCKGMNDASKGIFKLYTCKDLFAFLEMTQ